MDQSPSGAGGGNSRVLGDSAQCSTALNERGRLSPNYQSWVSGLARPYLGDDPFELGSGLGDYAERWLQTGVPRITVTEADPARLAHLRQRFDADERVLVSHVDLDAVTPAQHSCFVSFNVMEHIPDDVAAFRAAAQLVRAGGFVVTFAPAFEFAMSEYDREIGHVRRYTRRTMREAMTSAGLKPHVVRYVNPAGLAAWTVGMRMLKKRPHESTRSVSAWDKWVIPISQRIDNRVAPPFGQSVFAVAKVVA